MRQLSLSREHLDAMRAHVEACLPLEACGLLAGRGVSVGEVLLVKNQLQSATRFRMDPVDQIRAFGHLETSGMELIGIFHSHPADLGAMNPAGQEPSATDIAEAAYPVVQVIWARPNGQWQARGFWIESGQVTSVVLHLTDST